MGTVMILWMVKGKAVPVHAMKALRIVLQHHSFLTSAVVQVSGQLHALATSGKTNSSTHQIGRYVVPKHDTKERERGEESPDPARN
jgi:hypothetical protein